MKALGKLLGDFVAWRWAPAVGLCVASLFYVLVVVALVPDEIGVPVTNTRLAKKREPSTDEKPEVPTFPTTMPETEPAPPPHSMPVQPAGVVDFGRRGFTPPLERPEAPPAPPVMMPTPPVAPPPPVAEAPAPAEAPPPPVTEAPAVASAGPSATPQSPSGIMRQMQAFRGLMPRNGVPNAPGQVPNAPGQQPPTGEVPPEPNAPPTQ